LEKEIDPGIYMIVKAKRLAFILEQLDHNNYCIIDNVFPCELSLSLYQRLNDLYNKGTFKEATIGKDRILDKSVRSDKIYWWNLFDLQYCEKKYIKYLKFFQKIFNRRFYIGTNRIEVFYSIYEQGTFYTKHYDNFKNSNKRKITFITYLNKEWKKYSTTNGELVIYEGDKEIFVEPLFNRTVIFFSEFVLHEVLPATQTRFAITSWFYTGFSYL